MSISCHLRLPAGADFTKNNWIRESWHLKYLWRKFEKLTIKNTLDFNNNKCKTTHVKHFTSVGF